MSSKTYTTHMEIVRNGAYIEVEVKGDVYYMSEDRSVGMPPSYEITVFQCNDRVGREYDLTAEEEDKAQDRLQTEAEEDDSHADCYAEEQWEQRNGL